MVAGGPDRQDIFVQQVNVVRRSDASEESHRKLMHVVENVVSCAQSLCTVCNILSNVVQRLSTILAGHCDTDDSLRREKVSLFQENGVSTGFLPKTRENGGKPPFWPKSAVFTRTAWMGTFGVFSGTPRKPPKRMHGF